MAESQISAAQALNFLPADGEMAALVMAHDWSSTSLGPIDRWPQSLKTATGMILASPVPIVMLWGPDGHMIYNDAYSRLAGRRHPFLVGRKVLEGWPEVADFNRNVMAVGLAGGTLAYRDQELTLYRNDVAEQVWMDLDYSPVLDETGKPAGVIAIVVETTERVRSEAALRESEEQFRVFAQAMPNQVWAATAAGYLYWFNDQAYVYSGMAEGALDGETAWGAIVHPADLDGAAQRWSQSLKNGEVYESEFRIRRHDGVYRWFLVRAEPVRDAEGAVLRWVGTNTDIHDLRETESALRRANETLEEQVAARTAELQAKEARLRAIFETSFGFQGLLDPDGRLLDANAPMLAAMDCRLDDIAGMPFWETPWFSGTPGMEVAIREAVATVGAGGVVRQDLLVKLPVDGWRWFDFVLRPILAANGEVIAIVPEAIETTERRKAEEALRQSQKLEAMGQLTGGVAHDFNNLLTPIIGTLDLLHRREIGGERERRLVEGGLQSAERARMLVQRLLAFARRQPLQPRAVDVAALIRSMETLIVSTSGPRIAVDLQIEAGLPSATAEVNQLEMALLNLAVNARDAMPDGGTLHIMAESAHVTPAARDDLSPGDYVRIIVSDTGVGMDQATLAKAIEPFFSTKGIGKGTGLGLSMVHGLASQLGGALHIASKPGVGTTIELMLPVSRELPAPEPADATTLAADCGRGTVLLVDDEETVRAATHEMLAELGFAVVEAVSVEQALDLVDDHPIDLVVTDYLMAGKTGMDLVRTLREIRPGLPVMVISGYADAEGIAADVPRLPKPFRSAELAAMIDSVIGSRGLPG